MQRRVFLAAFAGGTVGWAISGALPDPAIAQAYPNPVPFVPDPGAVGLSGRPNALFAPHAARTASRQAATYPQSVASGDPNPHGVVLWTRIDPATVEGVLSELVGWQVTLQADFAPRSIVIEGVSAALSRHDNTVKLPIAHPALQPFSTYYYRFIHQSVASRTGRFKTMPPPADSLSQLRLGLVVCQDYSNGYYTALRPARAGRGRRRSASRRLHLRVSRRRGGGPNNGLVRVVPPYPSGASYPQNLADYRHLYQGVSRRSGRAGDA